QCALSCVGGSANCSGACVTVANDASHCGACGNNAQCLDTGVPNSPYFWNMNLNNLGGNGPIDWSQQGLIWRPAGDYRFGYYLITR
ncbi:MAG: hypothetical protein OSB21_11040, partial [Myxococcota bacterium]|nr:hypothetical protein [Myxococcota bacterium]